MKMDKWWGNKQKYDNVFIYILKKVFAMVKIEKVWDKGWYDDFDNGWNMKNNKN